MRKKISLLIRKIDVDLFKILLRRAHVVLFSSDNTNMQSLALTFF